MKLDVFCYADDILLSSTTVRVLQGLIKPAVDYVNRHGLRFNPSKTKCVLFGKNPFSLRPKWYIDNEELEIVEYIDYLGAKLQCR